MSSKNIYFIKNKQKQNKTLDVRVIPLYTLGRDHNQPHKINNDHINGEDEWWDRVSRMLVIDHDFRMCKATVIPMNHLCVRLLYLAILKMQSLCIEWINIVLSYLQNTNHFRWFVWRDLLCIATATPDQRRKSRSRSKRYSSDNLKRHKLRHHCRKT